MPDLRIEEQIRAAEKAEEPGSQRPKHIIHTADNELPANIVQDALDSAGYSYVYDIRTKERSVVNNNMLRSVLRRKDDEGHYVFTIQKPPGEPERGTTICYLHANHPMRETYNQMHLPVCRKSNLPSDAEARRHMKAKHKKEWETIRETEDRERQAEATSLQRAILVALEKSLAR